MKVGPKPKSVEYSLGLVDEETSSVEVRTGLSSPSDEYASTSGRSELSEKTKFDGKITLEFKKSLRIYKKRKVDPQDTEAAKTPEQKTKRLRDPARPDPPARAKKLSEGTLDPLKKC